MLSGPSLRSAFVLSINSLILSGFPLTFYHLAEASLECAVIQNYQEMSFFIIIHILVVILQSTCFICTTWKRKQAMEQQPNGACERTKSKQKQNQIDHALYCLIQPTNNVMVSLKDGFTVWRQSQKENFLSIIYCLAQHDVWSPRKANSSFYTET